MNDSLGYIDITKKPQKPKISLYLPNKVKIGTLTEAYNINHKLKLGNLNELSFNIPYRLEIHNRLISNKNIKKIKPRYLLKVENGVFKEWYLITNIKNIMDDDKDIKYVEAYSLSYELNDDLISNYNKISINAKTALIDALNETIWDVGYIDADFELMYRSFENIDSLTVLDFVFQIAETFNALIIWDTENRLVNLYKSDNIGVDKGLKFTYGHYLKTLSKEIDSEEMVTRLKVFGRDGLSIQRVNPTGANYIEDFSFFMYPFSRDENGNVLSHSNYMTDELCHALLDYQELVNSKQGEFNALLIEKETKESILSIKQNELVVLEMEMDAILDSLYIAQTTAEPYIHIKTQKDEKQIQIDAKNIEINTLEDEITDINTQIQTLKDTLAIKNNFTPKQIIEREQYIITREWKDENYINDKDLYTAALDKFEEIKKPNTIIDIDIVNFLEIIEEQRNWEKLNLGDIVTITYETIGVNVTAKIIEIEFDYEEANIKLKIANVKEILSDEEKLIKLLYKSASTSTYVDMNKYKWNNYEADLGKISNAISQMFDYTKNQINMAVNETVIVDRRGITVYDPNDPLSYLRITHGVLGITNDGGNTFKHAITSIGVVGERIYGRIISGEKVVIGDPDGILEIIGNKGIISDRTGREVMWFGLFETEPTEKFGLKLENDISQVIVDRDAGFIINRYYDSNWVEVASLNTEGYLHIFGLKIDYMDGVMTNGIIINPTDGIKITRNDNLVETILNATSGITIQRNNGSSWDKKFYIDTEGYLWTEDIKTKRLTIINSNEEILLDGNSLNFDFTTLNSIIMDDVIISSEKLTLYNQWISIQQTYSTLLAQINEYTITVYNNRDSSYSDLDNARTDLLNVKSVLETKYSSLDLALQPVFLDMNVTTHIKDDLGYTDDVNYTAREKFYNKFKEYHNAAVDARDRLENFLEKSSLQLGRNYNNVVIDALNGITVTADVGSATVITTLNATEGIKIKKNGIEKFYVDTDGILWAEDLHAKRLILYDNDNQLILDANSKFLDLNKFDKIVGNIQAENLSAKIFTADVGFINDLTVNHLKTLGMEAEGQVRNYIDIKDNYARWITAQVNGTTQATNRDGELLYWTDNTRTSTTTITSEGYAPVITNTYTETTKLQIYFDDNDPMSVPFMCWGAGTGVGNNQKGYMFKDEFGFKLDYYNNSGATRSIHMLEGGIVFNGFPAGTGNFKSTVTFPNRIVLPNVNYRVAITPTANPNGYIGEWWVTNKTTTGFTVQNSGSATSSFDYIVICNIA